MDVTLVRPFFCLFVHRFPSLWFSEREVSPAISDVLVLRMNVCAGLFVSACAYMPGPLLRYLFTCVRMRVTSIWYDKNVT